MDAYERLLCAILLCAWRDATGKRSTPAHRAAALAWLDSPGAECACDWLGLDVDYLRRRCDRLPTDEIGECPGGPG